MEKRLEIGPVEVEVAEDHLKVKVESVVLTISLDREAMDAYPDYLVKMADTLNEIIARN